MKKVMIAAGIGCLVMTSCTQVAGWFGANSDSTENKIADSSSYAAFARDESITEANAYSDLFLDSASVENYIQKEKLSDSAAKALRNFYWVRNYQYAWFTTSGMTEQARGLWNLYGADSVKSDQKFREHIDSVVQNDSLVIAKSDSSFAKTELDLTRQLVTYAQNGNNNQINGSSIYYLVPAKKQDPMQLADSILHKTDSVRFAGNKAYESLKQQLSIYYAAAKDSSWQNLPLTAKNLKKGAKGADVALLKKRLSLTGDYNTGDTSQVFSDSLETAIKDLQLRNGLAATGKLNDSLINILNVPPQQRVEQLLVNLNRMQWSKPVEDSSYILINIPTLMLYTYEGSNKVFEMPVIVGKEGTSTMMFSGDINQLVFNPTWHIPQSIVEREILPKMKQDPNYLKKNNMVVVSQKDSIPKINQLPGKENPLGQVKFLFPNSYDIYLHDTPDKMLFASKDRARSHGCIRVADAEKLSDYLLRNQGDWKAGRLKTAIAGDKEETVRLEHPEPVYITYYTAWIDENGKMNWREDVYGHDKETADRMFKRS